jgi:hypothetical protein
MGGQNAAVPTIRDWKHGDEKQPTEKIGPSWIKMNSSKARNTVDIAPLPAVKNMKQGG